MGCVFVFAHLSDTHFDGGERARDRASRVMEYLRQQPLDAILVTGDITDHGEPHEYEQAREVLAADVPVFVLPGNHDTREAFRKVLLGRDGGAAPVNQVRRVGPVTFALCDSTIPGRMGGLLAPETVAWLGEVLAGAAGPTFVCLHHPPVPLHNHLIDGIGLGEPAALAGLVRGSRSVVAVLCGHAHTAAAAAFAGRPLLVAPGVASTLRPVWTPPQTPGWQDALDLADPPAVAFHVLDEGGGLTTHYRVVPDAGQPGVGRPDRSG